MESTKIITDTELYTPAVQQSLGEHYEMFLIRDEGPETIEDIKDTLFRVALNAARVQSTQHNDEGITLCPVDYEHLERLHDFLANSQVILRQRIAEVVKVKRQ